MATFRFYLFQDLCTCAECGTQLMVPKDRVTLAFIILIHPEQPDCPFSGKTFAATKPCMVAIPYAEGQVIEEPFDYSQLYKLPKTKAPGA